MKYPKSFKKYVRDLTKELKRAFFVDQWDLTLAFDSEEKDNVAAEIKADHTYMFATITIRPRLLRCWERKEKRDINEAMLHEFCHLIIDPLYEIAKESATNSSHSMINDVRENQVQKMTNIISVLKLKKYNFRKLL